MPSVLIVDDEEDLCELLGDAFEMEDFEVHLAHNGFKGLEIFEKEDVDIIISDENMDEMNGHQFLEKLKALEKDLPFFYFSTGVLEADEEAMKEEGAHGLLSKPFDIDNIVERVKKEYESSKG